MSNQENGSWGPTLGSFLEEEGILEEADAYVMEKIQEWKNPESAKKENS